MYDICLIFFFNLLFLCHKNVLSLGVENKVHLSERYGQKKFEVQ